MQNTNTFTQIIETSTIINTYKAIADFPQMIEVAKEFTLSDEQIVEIADRCETFNGYINTNDTVGTTYAWRENGHNFRLIVAPTIKVNSPKNVYFNGQIVVEQA